VGIVSAGRERDGNDWISWKKGRNCRPVLDINLHLGHGIVAVVSRAAWRGVEIRCLRHLIEDALN